MNHGQFLDILSDKGNERKKIEVYQYDYDEKNRFSMKNLQEIEMQKRGDRVGLVRGK